MNRKSNHLELKFPVTTSYNKYIPESKILIMSLNLFHHSVNGKNQQLSKNKLSQFIRNKLIYSLLKRSHFLSIDTLLRSVTPFENRTFTIFIQRKLYNHLKHIFKPPAFQRSSRLLTSQILCTIYIPCTGLQTHSLFFFKAHPFHVVKMSRFSSFYTKFHSTVAMETLLIYFYFFTYHSCLKSTCSRRKVAFNRKQNTTPSFFVFFSPSFSFN